MKRFLLMLVICVSSFMIYTNNVKADTYNTGYWNSNNSTCDSGTKSNQNGFGICAINVGTSNFNKINQYSITSSLNSNANINKTNQILHLNVLSYATNSELSINSVNINQYGSGQVTKSGEGELMPYYIDNIDYTGNIDITTRNLFYIVRIYVTSDQKSMVSLCTSNNTTSQGFNNVECPFTKDFSSDTNVKMQVYFTTFTSTYTNVYIGVHYDMYYSTSAENSIASSNQQISNNTNEIKNDIKSDNVSGAEGSADDLKNNSAFQDNTGLSGVISMPLTFVNSLTNTCQPINLNIPYMDVDVTIPCMQSVITDKMPLLANLIKIIVNGFIVYRILLDIFQIVRNAKNPEDDRIEVLDL